MKSLTSWFILLVSITLLFSSCSSSDEKEEFTASDNSTSTTDNTTTTTDNTTTTTTLDTTAPIIAEVTAISTSTTDTTPNYTFSADEAGSITYGGSCSSSTTSATSGNNTITFTTLSLGNYNDCTIKVTDSIGNVSSTLTVSTFVIRAPSWKQESYIKASNNDSGGDAFGNSVSISVDTLAVGAFRERSNQTSITNGTTSSSNNSLIYPGAVYVYKRSGTSWVQEAYIKASNSDVRDEFSKVSISGDTLVVGVPNEDSNQTTITNGDNASSDNSNSASGAVYVYKRTGTTWVQEAYIKAANNDAADGFGYSISLLGDTLVIGAANETSNENTITNGDNASSNNSNAQSGAVYVYKRTGTSWAQEAYIKAVNNATYAKFGTSVSISDDTIAVGAPGERSNLATITNGTTIGNFSGDSSYSGAVYVYKRTGTSWAQEAFIKAVNKDEQDWFGSVVSISGDTLAVGNGREDSNQTTITNGDSASSDNSNSGSGAVYVYKRSGTSWVQEAYIKATNNDASDGFGNSVSSSGDTVVVGSGGEASNLKTITNGDNASSDNSYNYGGAVYVYTP